MLICTNSDTLIPLRCGTTNFLVGGLYGIALGKAFFGESMFSARANASKLALVALSRHLQAEGFGLIDCQVHSDHLVSMGAEEISRRDFKKSCPPFCLVKSGPERGRHRQTTFWKTRAEYAVEQ